MPFWVNGAAAREPQHRRSLVEQPTMNNRGGSSGCTVHRIRRQHHITGWLPPFVHAVLGARSCLLSSDGIGIVGLEERSQPVVRTIHQRQPGRVESGQTAVYRRR